VTRVTRTYHGHIEYDVTYTLDGDGLCTTVAPSREKPRGCVVFFGGSFTFGDGVDDADTLPSQVAVKTGGQLRVVNLGIGGAGAQQVLAQIEGDMVEGKSHCTPTRAIYSAIPHHVARAAGKPPSTNFGPRYVLKSDGRIVKVGRIEDARGNTLVERSRILSQLLKSHIYRRLEYPRLTDEDYRTYAAIVKASEQLFRQRFPGASFDVLLWDDAPNGDTALYEKVRGVLRREGLRVHLVPDIIPEYRKDRSRYLVSPHDRHPNARAYARLADWVATELLKDEISDQPQQTP